MKPDTVQEPKVSPAVRDEFDAFRRGGAKRYSSAWTRIDAAAAVEFTHGLREIPHVVDVLVASDSQGSDAAEANAFSSSKTDRLVTVTNSGAARFFRVRAF